ncbi:uncharacterized protein YcnI [Stackebrandtia albiflava]|uniref:Uncharacterized protein YcnI n=1 Tax=Stackebrandtia albiflava TaxID=406432 RepID=A0A562V4G7_9ACTN|nr:YcnI family protein [Stackebrandtia albiflava]TWJ12770.1 uncharacterized protein YcnI [Stackebrandtia albiflava]
MSTPIRRLAAVLAGAAVGVLAFAGPAAAHVTVDPGEAEAGGYARLDFRVPNESDEAATVRLEVNLPEDAPLASVRTLPVPGWTAEMEVRELDEPVDLHGRQITEAVSKITWTADDDAGIDPGEFGEFGVSVGPLPDSGVLIFKVIQVYSDGEESAWIDEPTTDGSEPPGPAPVLTIVPGDGDGDGHGDDAAADEGETDAETAADAEDDGGTVPLVLSIAAAVVSVVALVLAGLAWRRRDT